MKKNIKNRFYRRMCAPEGMLAVPVRIEESDLFILAEKDVGGPAREELAKQRGILKEYIRTHPDFYYSFTPVPAEDGAPEIILIMSRAALLAGVGPMAAVAGATADLVGGRILEIVPRVIVENGGDIFMRMDEPCTIGIFAGESPFSMKVGLKIPAAGAGRGIATSSGTVGHSHSAGRADAVTVIAGSAALADAAATHIGNLVKQPADFEKVRPAIETMPFIEGVLIIIGKEMFAWGQIELVSL